MYRFAVTLSPVSIKAASKESRATISMSALGISVNSNALSGSDTILGMLIFPEVLICTTAVPSRDRRSGKPTDVGYATSASRNFRLDWMVLWKGRELALDEDELQDKCPIKIQFTLLKII